MNKKLLLGALAVLAVLVLYMATRNKIPAPAPAPMPSPLGPPVGPPIGPPAPGPAPPAPAPGPARATWYGPNAKIWNNCPRADDDLLHAGKQLDDCKAACEQTPGCNAMYYAPNAPYGCGLRACPAGGTPPTWDYGNSPTLVGYATFPM